MTLDLAMNSYNTKGIGNKRKDKLDFMKIWNFYASKNTLKRVRRQLTWYEKRFVNHLSDNGLISKTYRELNETQQQKASNTTQKWKWKVKVKSLSHVRLLATPWTTAYLTPPSMGFSRQEYWSGVPLRSPGLLLVVY